MKKLLLILLVGIFYLESNSAPYRGEMMEFFQPDGSSIQVKLFGDEFYIRAESLDGYTLIRDENTKWICYAALSKDRSKLISTGIHYTAQMNEVALLSSKIILEKHIDIDKKAQIQQIEKTKFLLNGKKIEENKKTRGTPIVLVNGHIKGLCIVVDFSDEPATVPFSDFEAFCNDMNYSNYGNVGSVRKYFSDISGGLLDYENVVYGYFRAPNTFAYYDSLPYAKGARIILDTALRWIQSQGFDFTTLSLNQDNSIRAINLMYTGKPPVWAQGMWHHKGSYKGFQANGVTSNDYNCSPANAPLKISVVCHENGHMIGKWPDTYKYTNTTGVDGIGSFDLMCWPGNEGGNPVPPNPLFTANAGWKTVMDVSNYNGIIYDTANNFICYKYVNMNDTNEFFIFENRFKKGRSMQLPDQGLTVWHIDRRGNNQTTHHEVTLVHANNNDSINEKACFKRNFKKEYNQNTIPNSNFFNGDPSGLNIWDISDAAMVMNFKLGNGVQSPKLRLLYGGVSNDDNQNGMIEPGEKFDFNIQALNIGQMNASNVDIQCSEIFQNQFLTINNPMIQNQNIASNDTLPISFYCKISDNAEIGTELTFRFSIKNEDDSIYITKTFIIGKRININNSNDTSCAAVFFDNGGESAVYSDNVNYVKTFFPENKYKPVTIRFDEFDLENDEKCEYDYLEIFNGKDTNATLIGRYCGMNSPGTISSTDESGALTFRFVSDENETHNGWKALVRCLYMKDFLPEDFINLIPNPGQGNCTIRVYNEPIKEISVYDLMGNRVKHIENMNQKDFNLNMSTNANGIYFIRIQTSTRTVIKKWVNGK